MAGYRMHVDGEGVGSLVVGLHDDAGGLHHCGVAAASPPSGDGKLVDELAPYVLADPEPASVGGVDGPGRPTPRAR